MHILDEDLILIWKSLHSNEVIYLMVGGFAVNLHEYARFTGDVDIWIKDTLETEKISEKP